MKKVFLILLTLCLVTVLFAGCGGDTASNSSLATASSQSAAEESSAPSESESSETTSEPTVTEAPKIDLTSLLEGRTGNTEIPGWDPDNKNIKTSHSLEVGWAGGYGKGFLIDGVVGTGVFPPDIGMYASCTLADDNVTLNDVNKTKNVSEFIQIKLPGVYNVSKVSLYPVLRSNRGFPQAFTISVSEDGKNFTKVREETNYYTDDFNPEQPFVFAPVKAQYVRIDISKVSMDFDPALKYSVVLAEIEVYGEKIG